MEDVEEMLDEVSEEGGVEEEEVDSSVGVDLDSYSEAPTVEQVSRLVGRREARRPDISGLQSAIGVDGYPAFVAGDRIVIERYASFLAGRPYLDTRTYRVESVDLDSGKVNLWDESLYQYASDNWRHGVSIGQVYKFVKGRLVSSKGRRGRPRKESSAPVEAAVPVVVEGKRRRGRPPGVKNRAKP